MDFNLDNIKFPNTDIVNSLSKSGGAEARKNEYINSIWQELENRKKNNPDTISEELKNISKEDLTKKLQKDWQKNAGFNGLPTTIKSKDFTECIQQTIDTNLVQRHVINKNRQPLATTTASNFKGHNNYYEYNEQGEKTNFIEYQDFGTSKTQKMHFSSENGSFDKEITHSGDTKSMKTTIIDKNGKTTTIERTYKSNNNGTSTSTINGEKYDISGLNGNIISVKTPSGETIKLDLEKFAQGANEIEKSKIKEYIKLLPGDVLENLSKETTAVKFFQLDRKDGFYDAQNEALWLSKYNDNETTLHELAHAMDAYNGGQHSSSETFKNIFNYERNNAPQNALGDEIKHSEYLLTDRQQNDTELYRRKGAFSSNREMFADCYALMNDMEIGQIPARQLLVMRTFQGTMDKVAELTQSSNLNSKERKY